MASWRPFFVTLALLGLPGWMAAARAQEPLPPHPHPSVTPPPVSLMPGQLVGDCTPYRVRAGDSIYRLAVRCAVNPVRIYKPNARRLAHGLQAGHRIVIDERRIQPDFPPGLSGIVLNVPEAQVYFLRGGRCVSSYPVGVSMGDWPVPLIETHVVDMEKNPEWVVPKSIQAVMKEKGEKVIDHVDPGPDNPLGVRWIGFANGTYGFHGTNDPGCIKHYYSHGCVRFRKADIVDLYRRVSIGTPVTIDYQPVLMAVEHGHIWLSVYPDIYKLAYDFKGAVRTLARAGGVTRRLQWATVDRAIAEHDGIVVDAAQGLPKPRPRKTPRPSPKPSPTASTPSPSPVAPASGVWKMPES